MAIKKNLVIICILLVHSIGMVAQGTEEQRKYKIGDKNTFVNFIQSSASLDGLSLYNHSQYTYYDIYLDTPEFDLYKNGYSFRFRKRVFNDTLITYGLQLKSEMKTDTSVRMEVEEKDLTLYKIKTKNGWVNLIDVIDELMAYLNSNSVDTKDEKFVTYCSYIQQWIEFKVGSTIVPFQRMMHLGNACLAKDKMKTLKPVLLGCEKRTRSHVYIDSTVCSADLKQIPHNGIEPALLPSFFKSHLEYNWVLETSLDAAVFYPIFKSGITKSEIFEFEVENKCTVPEMGTQLMSRFEKTLKKNFNVTNQIDSKYKQSIKLFLN